MESEDSQPQTTDTATVQTTKAAEPTLLASWDFTGKNGTTNSAIADSTGKYNLTLKDGAKIEQYGDRSNNEALSLRGDGQYAQIDDQLFKDAGDSFTLEFASKTRHDDSGKFFSFIVGKDGSNDANTTDQANANKYLMFYNSKTAIKGVISNNNWGNEQGSKVTVSGNDNSWADYKIVVDGTNLAVFRNNALIIFKANTGIKMSDLGATTAYIGKSFYSVDEYWNGAMDDIKVYRGADLTMPTAVAISGTGVVNNKLTLIEKDSTKLTATASYNGGEKVTKTIEVTVKEKTRIAPDTGYAAVTFESDSNGGEKARVASTEKNDFFTFKTRNNGQAVLTNDADTGGLRDMFVLRSHEGDKYYLIATDLKVSSMGWSQNQVNGSRKVEVYESTDMMNWTRTNGDGNGGITINTPNAGMTWAPEAYWDDDLNAYVVFFSSRMFTDDTRTTPVKNDKTGNSSYAQVRYAITRDFVNFTEPQMWQDTGYSRIDSTVRKIGGYYYRFTKNEQGGAAGDYITTGKSIFLERSKVLTAPTTEASPGQDPNTGWQLLEQALLPFEGPETIKLNKDDELNTKDDDGYILLSDNFAYRAFMTTGAELSKTTWDNPMTKRYPDFNNEKKPVKAEPGAQGYITQGANGGLPDKVRHGAFVNVPESVLKVTKSWTAANPTHIEAVDSTTKAVYNAGTRELTATVTAADKGTLAGSVKFSAGDWSKTVKLDAEGKATVTLPASVSGTVAVAYDGYTDGLVNPSDTTVDGIEQGKVDLAELNKQIAAAEALKESDYTADSWAKLAKALQVAKAALASSDQAVVDKAAADLTAAIAALQKAETPTKPDTGDGDNKGDNAGDKTDNKTDDTKSDGKLPATGAAVYGVSGAMVLLAAAGIALSIWRKRRA